MVADAGVVVVDGIGYQVCSPDDDGEGFFAYDEETMNETFITYEEIDLDRDMFYKLTLMDSNDYTPPVSTGRTQMEVTITLVEGVYELRSVKRDGRLIATSPTLEQAEELAKSLWDIE
jgi:hypothetical protein